MCVYVRARSHLRAIFRIISLQNEKRRTNDGKVLVEKLKISYRIRIGIVVFVCALHRVFVGFVFQKLR